MPTEQELQQIQQALRDWGRYWAGNGMLDALGVPALARLRGEHRDERFRRRLELLDDAQVAELRDFFEIDREPRPHWGPGFRLFVSHLAASVEQLLPLAKWLNAYGIESFLAHRDIDPGRRWHDELTGALRTMDGLLSFHVIGYAESPWCGQEVGFALGRDVVVVPLKAGEDPQGFIAQIQAIRWNPHGVRAVAAQVVQHLREDARAVVPLGNGLARKLKFSQSFDGADFLVAELRQCGRLSETARHDVQLAEKLNNQVSGRTEALLEGQE